MGICEDSDVEEERPGVLDDALKDAIGWFYLECTYDIPKFSIKNIHQYSIKRKVRIDQVTASKPFERSYCIYKGVATIEAIEAAALYKILK